MMRPQLASSPKKAVLTRAELAMVWAALKASSSSRAPTTRMVTSLVAPSPSRTIFRARSLKTLSRASPNSRAALGLSSSIQGLPAAPLAMTSTMSLVEVSPSTVMRLKVRSTPLRTSCRSTGKTICASVTTNESMVAMSGMIMPEPLATPSRDTSTPSMTTVAEAILGTVSVVIMAWASVSKPSAERCAASSGMARAKGSMARRWPMTPVEATWTRDSSMASAPAARALTARAAAMPSWPVQALALPLLTTTAWASPERSRSMSSCSGAALTRLVVNMPAVTAGTSE